MEDLTTDSPEIAETGRPLKKNARLKAETISQLTGKMLLSRHSGPLKVVLGGLPGVCQPRFGVELEQ